MLEGLVGWFDLKLLYTLLGMSTLLDCRLPWLLARLVYPVLDLSLPFLRLVGHDVFA